MLRRITAATVIAISALSACTSAPSDEEEAISLSQALWSNRTEYAGDNSKVVTLVDLAGFSSSRGSSVTLGTTKPPYSVKVTLGSTDKPFEATDFSRAATLVLGTVANLDRIEVASRSESGTYSLTSAEATKQLGYDVKSLGKSQQSLDAYVRATSSLPR
jgi:hypothetical protein